MSATPPRRGEPVLLATTLALAALVPLAAHHHLGQRVSEDLAPALSALVDVPVRVGGVDADLTGAVRLQQVSVGGMMTADAVEAAGIPSLGALARGDVRVREIRVEAPRLHVRVDRRGRTDVEAILDRMRGRVRDLMNERARAGASAPGSGSALPRIVVARGALAVAIGDCGQAEVRGIEILPRRGGVRAVAADIDVALDCGDWRIRGSLGRAAADIALPALAIERALAVGGRAEVGAAAPGRTGQRPVTVMDLSLAHGVDDARGDARGDPLLRARGVALRGRVLMPGADATFTLHADRDADGLRATLRGHGLPLAPFSPLVPRSIDLSRGRGSGHLALTSNEGVRVDLDASLEAVLVDDRRVADVPLELGGRIEAALATTAGAGDGAARVDLERVRFVTGALAIEARGQVRYDSRVYWLPDRGDVEVQVPRVACADALAALPAGLRDRLAGMALDGELEAALRLRFDRDSPRATAMDLDLDVDGCRVLREAAGADPRALLASFEQRFANGTRRPLGAREPGYVPLARMPAYLPQAFVSAEDARFFGHSGFDALQIERSLAVNLRDRAFVRGGSTISQQTVKNLFLSHRRTLARKLQEAVLTWRLEAHLDKRAILERYLNIIELGPGVFGVEEAARYWFGKSATAIDLHEAAFLAALTPAPQSLSRRIIEAGGVDEGMRRRIDSILATMRRERLISEPARARAQRARLSLAAGATRG